MIVRKLQNCWTIVTQPDHAWASGEIANAVIPEFVDQRFRSELQTLIARHDDGWVDWETSPRLLPSGVPVNFDDIDQAVHEDIWRRGIQIAADSIGPYAAAVLIRHAQALTEETDFSRSLAMRYTEYTRRAMPSDDPVVREWHVERGFHLLRLCDVLTLMPAAGWREPQAMLLLNKEAQPFEVTARMSGDWLVELDAWPFAPESLEVVLPLTRIENEEWEAGLNSIQTGKRENQILRIVPQN